MFIYSEIGNEQGGLLGVIDDAIVNYSNYNNHSSAEFWEGDLHPFIAVGLLLSLGISFFIPRRITVATLMIFTIVSFIIVLNYTLKSWSGHYEVGAGMLFFVILILTESITLFYTNRIRTEKLQ